LIEDAYRILEAEVAMNQSMAARGAALVQHGESILTHCNTGSLATPGVGTALGVIREAHRQGKNIHVFVDETRPLLQGGRLTAYELKREGIPYTLICDNMAASLMRAGKISRVFVGADRIALNGDFANKIGTYSVAVLARHHNVPFHAVAPVSTVDIDCVDGSHIEIEQRSAPEVRGVSGSFGLIRWAPADSPVHNPAFDVTPSNLVTSIVLDTGVYSAKELNAGVLGTLKQFKHGNQ
jgi:methylthioribose-1-phosphate isomerase